MLIKLSFLAKIIVIALMLIINSYADVLPILPLKKPILDPADKIKKITKNIIKPKKKPSSVKFIKSKELAKNSINTTEQHTIEVKNKITQKKQENTILKKFLIPKSKPLIVKKESVKIQAKSKYFKQKDFDLAKRSIQ